jgi:type I restriction enzyme R subunit
VDAITCKLVVLDQTINSMTKFKQIIGRGTRINEDYKKLWFTIMDFRKATENFADPAFDGDPEVVYVPPHGGPTVPPDDEPDTDGTGSGSDDNPWEEDGDITGGADGDGGTGESPAKYYVKGVNVKVVAERVQYMGSDGKLITESLKDYTTKTVKQEYATLNDFLRKWNDAEQKNAIIQELEDQGVLWQALEDEVGKDYGPFDLICHVVYGQPPLTRKERANNVRKRDVFTKYGEQAKNVLEALLDKYADEGITQIEDTSILKIQPFNTFGRPLEIIKGFGGKEQYQQAIRELEHSLYEAAND